MLYAWKLYDRTTAGYNTKSTTNQYHYMAALSPYIHPLMN
jgi:hypothetical protein